MEEGLNDYLFDSVALAKAVLTINKKAEEETEKHLRSQSKSRRLCDTPFNNICDVDIFLGTLATYLEETVVFRIWGIENLRNFIDLYNRKSLIDYVSINKDLLIIKEEEGLEGMYTIF